MGKVAPKSKSLKVQDLTSRRPTRTTKPDGIQKRPKKVKKNKREGPVLNPMVFYQRFQLITKQIFEVLDNRSLQICRKVSKSWQKCIDQQIISWTRHVDIPTVQGNGDSYFHLAAKIRDPEVLVFKRILDSKQYTG